MFPLHALPIAGVLFVLFMYYGSRILNPWSKPGDCTKWIKFKDPKLQESYKGKRIDIETMYEMYFNSELDFKEEDLMEVFKNRLACSSPEIPSADMVLTSSVHSPSFVGLNLLKSEVNQICVCCLSHEQLAFGAGTSSSLTLSVSPHTCGSSSPAGSLRL